MMLCSGRLVSSCKVYKLKSTKAESLSYEFFLSLEYRDRRNGLGGKFMRSLDENIESLERAMISEAKAEADQKLADSRARADAVRQRGQEESNRVRAEVLDRARQDAERLRGQVIATTQMKARTIELEHREKLLIAVFTASKKQLPTVQQWTDYDQIAQSLLREALIQLGTSKALVRADALTRKCLTDPVVRAISKELNVEIVFGEPLEQGNGVRVETPDGHLNFDNILETRLSRLQNALRAPVYRLLIGESL